MKFLKSVAILTFMFFTFFSYAQKDGEEFKYEKIYELENISKKKLYSKVNAWYAEFFNNSSDAIVYKDAETGEVRGNYEFVTSDRMFRVKQNLIVLVKDNKVKIVIKKPFIKLIYIAGKGEVNRPYKVLKRKKYKKKTLAKWEKLDKSLMDYLRSDNDSDNDW